MCNGSPVVGSSVKKKRAAQRRSTTTFTAPLSPDRALPGNHGVSHRNFPRPRRLRGGRVPQRLLRPRCVPTLMAFPRGVGQTSRRWCRWIRRPATPPTARRWPRGGGLCGVVARQEDGRRLAWAWGVGRRGVAAAAVDWTLIFSHSFLVALPHAPLGARHLLAARPVHVLPQLAGQRLLAAHLPLRLRARRLA